MKPVVEGDNIQKNLEQLTEIATEHVKSGKIQTAVAPRETNCIDGRFDQETLVNAENLKDVYQRPGGAEGISMIMLRLGYSAKVAYESVLAFCQSRNMSYGWHTDHHDKSFTHDSSQTSQSHRGICLSGDHNEKFVFFVTKSNGWSVLPKLEGSSAFVYDLEQDNKFLKEFTDWFNKPEQLERYSENRFLPATNTGLAKAIDYIELSDARDAQNMITLKLLAKDLPIFAVEFDNQGSITLSTLGVVEQLSETEQQQVQVDGKFYQNINKDVLINPLSATGCGHANLGINDPLLYEVSRDGMLELEKLVRSSVPTE